MPEASSNYLYFRANKTSQEIFSAFKQGKRIIFTFNSNNYNIPKMELKTVRKNQYNQNSNEGIEYNFANENCTFSNQPPNEEFIGWWSSSIPTSLE